MEINRHTMMATNAYIDLLDKHIREDLSLIRGTPRIKKIGARSYWYDTYRVGTDIISKYLGEDTPTLRAQIEDHQNGREDAKARKRRMSMLARTMNADGFLRLDKTTGSLFSAMSRAGIFRYGGVLIGTHAFRAYEGELGIRLQAEQSAAFTDDIDIAAFERLSLAIAETDRVLPAAARMFADLKFRPIPALRQDHVWKWEQTRGEAVIEFLTPSFGSGEGTKALPALGVAARALNHLNYLIREPINAVLNYGPGILVKVPAPERFAIHKLIVAERRLAGPNPQKARKDRLQAAVLIHTLAEDRPYQLIEALDDALAEGPKWKDHIKAALARMPREAEALDQARVATGLGI
jgi:hypothetical protein